jgi:hypothetical protein
MEGTRDIDQSKLQFRFDKQRPLPIGDFAPAKRGVLFARREIFELFGSIILQSRHKFYTAKPTSTTWKYMFPWKRWRASIS